MFCIKPQPIRLPNKSLALTFDDGPGPQTIQIAEFLHERGIPATFFVVGSHVAERPDVVRRLIALGHSIGNHTMTHRSLPSLASSPQMLIDEVLGTHRLIEEIVGEGPSLLRPPFGLWSPTVAKVLDGCDELQNYQGPINWDINFNDYEIGFYRQGSTQDPVYPLEQCRENYLQGILARQSGVVLLHDWSAGTGELAERLRRNNRTLELTQWLVSQLAGFNFVGLDDICNPARSSSSLSKLTKRPPLLLGAASLPPSCAVTSVTETMIEETFNRAVRQHQSQCLPEAEQLYRDILSRRPTHAGATHYLGVIAHQQGDNDIATDLIGRAIALNPSAAPAHNSLGIVLQDKGLTDHAVAAYRDAISLRPTYAEAYCNLGSALGEMGQADQAITACQRAIALKPGYATANSNLGNAFKDAGRIDEAVAAYRAAVAARPNFPEAHNNLGCALAGKKQFDEAIAAYRQAIALRPSYAEAHGNLGNVLRETGRLDDAIAAYRHAIAIRPTHSGYHSCLAAVLSDKGRLDEAIAAYHQAIALGANHVETHNDLGNALERRGRLDEAIAAYRRAIAINPNSSEAYSNLGSALKGIGQLDEAIAAYRHSMDLKPDSNIAHSNLILTLQYHSDYQAPDIAAEEHRWNIRYAEPLRSCIRPHDNDPAPNRRLRVGYVSADFCTHASALFLVPLLQNHDPDQVEIFCYAQVRKPDATTRRLQQCTQHWRSTVGLSDEQVAQQIRDDGIDILVDLKLHTANNRLLVFARKPAPVQLSWLGYPGSTGLTAIDYRLSDPYLDPPGFDESIWSEKTVRLPDSFWCYDPLECWDIPVNNLPAAQTGHITFGCLNNFCKINDSLLVRWAQILHRVDSSRLLLLCNEGSHRQRTLGFLAGQGIEPRRIEFIEYQPRREYLSQYHRVDIGLDSFPCNGHTTTLDSLWMGVPVVTQVGQTPASRAGWSQLSNLGLRELAAQTADQYVNIAVALANDLPRLQSLRASLRQRTERSPLMNGPRFAGNIEAAYRRMWCIWCDLRCKSACESGHDLGSLAVCEAHDLANTTQSAVFAAAQ
jgi:predicted O-linked N-acetylglucosamine transferase (SPINDLY family)/peptidoglycan/xylan/chitin deacetylase (PgdA/CDA1 family)